jgi:hypothetical protein
MKLNFETILWGVMMLDSISSCGFAWTTRGGELVWQYIP